MITLITGTPGAGKTAWLVQELTRLPTQRKIYVHGIPELKIAHEPVWCRSEHCDHCRSFDLQIEKEIEQGGEPFFLEQWHKWVTHGSLIVADEVQRVWRPRSPGSKITEDIAKLETHRHMGVDFWLISQGPHLFDSNVRLLVGRHIHLVANWLGRKEYEWPECRQNLTSRADAVTRPYKLPKQIFGMYKSASLHTKLDKRKPMTFYVMVAALIAVVLGGYQVSKKIGGTIAAGSMTGASANQDQIQPVNLSDADTANAGAGAAKLQDLPDFKPAIEGQPETAPAYRHLLKVTAIPILAGCIKSATSCKCYTAQATPYPVTWEQCQEHVANLKFNPYASNGHTASIPSDNKASDYPDALPGQGIPVSRSAAGDRVRG